MILSPEADSYELTYSAWQKVMLEQYDKKSTALRKRGGGITIRLFILMTDFSLMATHYFFMFKFNE